MIVSDIFTEIRNECDTNSTKVSDAFLLVGVNLDYAEVVMQILKVKTDFNFNAKEAYATLLSVSGVAIGVPGYNGEYTFPSDLLRPIRVEISYDGEVWYPAKFYDVADNTVSSEEGIAENNSTNYQFPNWTQFAPFVRFERDSFFVRPLKTTTGNISGGIRIWYEKRQVALTAPDTPLFEENFHRLMVLRGALRVMRKFRKEYKKETRDEVKTELRELETEMMEFYKNRFKKQFVIRPTVENMR